MAFVEVMGQCAKCKDFITVELEEKEDTRHAHVHLAGKFYQIREGRTYSYTPRTTTLTHKGIVVPCSGRITLRGGLTPLATQHDDEPSHFPKYQAS